MNRLFKIVSFMAFMLQNQEHIASWNRNLELWLRSMNALKTNP